MSHSDDPSLWLRYAEDDLTTAQANVPMQVRGYHPQQAAEKAIKAMLIHHGIDFPWVHDLRHLATLLPPSAYGPSVDNATELTAYASAARYPRHNATYKPAEVADAVELARAVVAWAANIIEPA